MSSETDNQSIDSVIPSSLSYLSSPLLAPSFDSDASLSPSTSFLWSRDSASDGFETKSFTRTLSYSSVIQPSPPPDFHSFIDLYKLTDFHGASYSDPAGAHSSDSHWSVSSLGSASPNPSTITITNEYDSIGLHQAALAVSASLLSASDDEPSALLDLCLPPIASSSSIGVHFPHSEQTDEKHKSDTSAPSSPSTSLSPSSDSWPSPSSSLSTTSALPLQEHDVTPLPIPLIPLSDLGLRNYQPLNFQPRSVLSNSESSAEMPRSPVPSYSKAPVESKPARYHHSGPTQSHANDFLDIPYTLRNPTPSRPRFRITLLQFPVDVSSHNVSISVLLHSNKQSDPVASLSVLKDHLPQLNVALPPDFKFDAKSQYRMSVSVTRRGDSAPFWNHSISVPLRGKLRPHPYDM